MRIERENGTVIEDVMDKLVETEEGVTCGCDNPNLTMTCHMDGRDFYTYNYSCACGNSIALTRKRSKEEMMLWG